MRFSNAQANEAAAIMSIILGLTALVAVFGYAMYLLPWQLGVFLGIVLAVPVIAGFWPTKEKPGTGPG